MVMEGVGIDYTTAAGPCGSPLTVTLPSGATPVTSFLYVEYNAGSFVSGNPVAINFNGNTTPTGSIEGAPVSYVGWTQTYYNVRYALNPSWISTAGQSTYTVSTSANSDSCQGLALMVIYKNPSQATTNAIAIADGNNAWHIESNGVVVYGAAPPDTKVNWNCLGLSCGSSSTKFSALGGRISCNEGQVNGDEDQIETWGSGPTGG